MHSEQPPGPEMSTPFSSDGFEGLRLVRSSLSYAAILGAMAEEVSLEDIKRELQESGDIDDAKILDELSQSCLLYTSPSPRDS